jgi:hypothetical protein
MAHRPPFDQQNGDEHHQFNLYQAKRQRDDYGNWEASVDTTEDHYNSTSFSSWDIVSTSTPWPGNAYFFPPDKQMERKEPFLVQKDPIERTMSSLGATWHTPNQDIFPQETTPDISTVWATSRQPTHSFPTQPFPTNSCHTSLVSTSVGPTSRNAEHAALPLRHCPLDVSIEITTANQVCFGMASNHQSILSSTADVSIDPRYASRRR